MTLLRSFLLMLSMFAIANVVASPGSPKTSGRRIVTLTSGLQEVPTGVTTRTSAILTTQFDDRFEYAYYSLSVSRGVGITQAHFHCAPAGENGPVVVFFFGPVAAGKNLTRGVLSAGYITNDDILSNVTNFKNTTVCGVTINNIASLFSAIKKNLIYFNLHTLAHPAGEVRGQVLL